MEYESPIDAQPDEDPSDRDCCQCCGAVNVPLVDMGRYDCGRIYVCNPCSRIPAEG